MRLESSSSPREAAYEGDCLSPRQRPCTLLMGPGQGLMRWLTDSPRHSARTQPGSGGSWIGSQAPARRLQPCTSVSPASHLAPQRLPHSHWASVQSWVTVLSAGGLSHSGENLHSSQAEDTLPSLAHSLPLSSGPHLRPAPHPLAGFLL